MKSTNAEIEARAAKAARGEGYDWNTTPIGETDTARRTDPMSGGGCRLGDGWWQHSEPDFLKQQGQRFARSAATLGEISGGLRTSSRRSYGRDATADPRTEEEKYNETTGANDASYEFADYLPASDEDAYSWLTNLYIYVEQTPDREAAFEALKKYIHSFELGTRGADLDGSKLRDLLRALCGQPGGLLTRRAA